MIYLDLEWNSEQKILLAGAKQDNDKVVITVNPGYQYFKELFDKKELLIFHNAISDLTVIYNNYKILPDHDCVGCTMILYRESNTTPITGDAMKRASLGILAKALLGKALQKEVREDFLSMEDGTHALPLHLEYLEDDVESTSGLWEKLYPKDLTKNPWIKGYQLDVYAIPSLAQCSSTNHGFEISLADITTLSEQLGESCDILEKEFLAELQRLIPLTLTTVIAEDLKAYMGLIEEEKKGVKKYKDLLDFYELFKESHTEYCEHYLKYLLFKTTGTELSFSAEKAVNARTPKITSPADIKGIFSVLGFDIRDKTGKSTTSSINIDEYLTLNGSIPLLKTVLEHRGTSKLKSSYTLGLLKHATIKGDVLHLYPRIIPGWTNTRRLSSKDPAAMVLPKRGRVNIRKYWKFPKGYLAVKADYDGQETFIAAEQSQDPFLLHHLKAGSDFHSVMAQNTVDVLLSYTGQKITVSSSTSPLVLLNHLGDPVAYCPKDFRNDHKKNLFAKFYGAGLKVVGNNITPWVNDFVPPAYHVEAVREVNDKMNSQLGGLKLYQEKLQGFWKMNGYVEANPISRRRIYAPNMTQIVNAPIQSTGADVLKMALILYFNEVKKRGIDSWLIHPIHDEIYVSCLQETYLEVTLILRQAMEAAFKAFLPTLQDYVHVKPEITLTL